MVGRSVLSSTPKGRNNSQQFGPLFDTLRNGHPHQAGKLAEEAIGLCLDTVWKASKSLRTDSNGALDAELMRACLDGLTPINDIVDALTENPEIGSSMGRYEGYLTIAGKIDLLFRHVDSCLPDWNATWKALRQDVGDLLDCMHLKRATATRREVNHCREKLLQTA